MAQIIYMILTLKSIPLCCLSEEVAPSYIWVFISYYIFFLIKQKSIVLPVVDQESG